jgi:hypothetical protein
METMRTLEPKRNHWPVIVLIAVAAIFVAREARGQIRGQPPRPGIQPGRAFQPQNRRPRPPVFQPGPFNNGPVQMVTVYACLRCGKEVGRGPVAPAPPCPFCGFAGDPMRITVQMPVDAPAPWASRISPTLLYTVGAEGSLMAGLVLAGILRLGINRLRQRPIAVDEA